MGAVAACRIMWGYVAESALLRVCVLCFAANIQQEVPLYL